MMTISSLPVVLESVLYEKSSDIALQIFAESLPAGWIHSVALGKISERLQSRVEIHAQLGGGAELNAPFVRIDD
jgi:hypothetical protein